MSIYCFNISVNPVTTIHPMSQISMAATNVTFTCVANANPRAIIQWSFNGNVLRNTSDIDGSRYYIINEIEGNCSVTDPPSQCEASSTLEIVNTQLADSGEYTCNASNAAGADTVSANLTVTSKFIIIYRYFNILMINHHNYTYVMCTNKQNRCTVLHLYFM